MRIAGIVLTVIGLVGALIYGIQAIRQTEAFTILGIDITVSGANWTPVIISVIIFVIGLAMMSAARGRTY
jgi:hypothetical protein